VITSKDRQMLSRAFPPINEVAIKGKHRQKLDHPEILKNTVGFIR
jgi:hypothetical protein